jgi:tetratricopeptide (TPR) repeat protein
VIGSLISRNSITIATSEPLVIEYDANRVIVLPFTNNTGDESLDIIGQMAADRIEHSITQNNLAVVISNNFFEEYEEIIKKRYDIGNETSSVNSFLSIDQRIEGRYYLDGEYLLFDCSIIDVRDGKVKDVIEPIRTLKINPLDAIERIRQRILGYLATKSSSPQLFIEVHTPKFIAYRHLLVRKEDPENELYHLEQAILIDSNYFESKLLRLSYYYNMGEFYKVDSLYKILCKSLLVADDRQKNLLAFYNALINGNNRLIYNYYLKEYGSAPFHLPSNSTMMFLALQFVNRPDQVLNIYNDIPSEGLDMESCNRCRVRSYIKAMAYFRLEDHALAIKELEALIKIDDKLSFNRLLIKALARTRSWNKVDNVINLRSNIAPEDLGELYYTLGKECFMIKETSKSVNYFKKAIEADLYKSDKQRLGRANAPKHIEIL